MHWSHSLKPILIIAIAVLIGLCLLVIAIVLRQQFPHYLPKHSTAGSVERAVENRHRYGNPEAETVIVEFFDYSCGYCAKVHPTLKRLVDESGGRIAWEYRHLPILNSVSKKAAIAGECVASLSSEADAFFTYTEAVLAAQSELSATGIDSIAQSFVADHAALASCMEDNAVQVLIDADVEVARALGARGTPYSVVLFPSGEMTPVSGALPYNEWKALLQPS